MLLPIGHSETGVRRLPWISFGIMGICLLTVIWNHTSPFDEVEGAEDVWYALKYYMEHPYLEAHPMIAELASESFDSRDGEAFREAYIERNRAPSDRAILEQQQAKLDELTDKALNKLGYGVYYEWGLTASEFSLITLFTHMFMHGGWFHLIGNMLIFYLAGPFIEDVWGRPIFIGFYLCAGIFAALVEVFRFPDSTVPMVGASGAIAGVMGAFLMRYWHTKIRFFYWFGFFWRGTFDAPAWLMLPLWFGQQLFYGMMTGNAEGAGVAYWAHIGGFVFGVGVAFGMRQFKIEERFVASTIDTKVNKTVIDNTGVEQALEAHARGESADALAALGEEARRAPGNPDAVLAYWNVALETDRLELAVPAMLMLVQHELRAGDIESALARWTELTDRSPGAPADPALLLRIAQSQVRIDRKNDAATTLRRALMSAGTGMTSDMAMRIARTAREVEPLVAQGAARLALEHQDLDPAERAFAEELLSAPVAVAAGLPPSAG